MNDDKKNCEHSSYSDDDELKTFIVSQPHTTFRELAGDLEVTTKRY